MLKRVVLTLFLAISFAFSGEGLEYAKKGIECKERGNKVCTISNLEKALDTGELNLKQIKTVKNFLRTVYHEIIEINLEKWSLEKTNQYCKRGIELSDELSLSGDWYDISFYLWRAIAYGDNGQKQKAKKIVKKAERFLSSGRYKQEFKAHELKAFDKWANKIIRTIKRL